MPPVIDWYAENLQPGDQFVYADRIWTVEWVHPIPPIHKINLMIRDRNGNALFVLLANRQLVNAVDLA